MSNPTAKQIRFREYMRDLGCCVSGEDWIVQIHHVLGREAKSKGVGNIGHWYVLPLAFMYHDVSATYNPLNVTHNKNDFEAHFGTQAELFNKCLNTLIDKARINKNIDSADFPPHNVVEAITNYRR